MKRLENMFLSKDKTQIIDKDGHVKFVATKNDNSEEFFIKPEDLERGKVCVGWDSVEVCVSYDQYKVCIGWESKKVCVEWSFI